MEVDFSSHRENVRKPFLTALLVQILAVVCLFKHGNGVNITKTVIKYLPNEYCKPHETLIDIDQTHNKYFPMVVKLHKCGGTCHNHPSVKKCEVDKAQTIGIKVRRMFDRKSFTLSFQNHTSCKCPCTSDETSCNAETQVWNHQFCSCECKPGGYIRKQQCRPPFEWHSSTCSCKCRLQCQSNQIADNKNCRCMCKQETYQRCIALNQNFDIHTCQCLAYAERATGQKELCGLSNKWIAILFLLGILVFVALVFDCVLFAKKTGIGHKVMSCCRGRQKLATDDTGSQIALTPTDESYHGFPRDDGTVKT